MRYFYPFCLIFILAMSMIVVSCQESYSPPIDKETDFENTNIEVTVEFYDDRRELSRSFLENEYDREPTNQELQKFLSNSRLEGYANLFYYASSDEVIDPEPECHIKAMRPRGGGDEDRIETLGHELLHCLYARWHDQPDY